MGLKYYTFIPHRFFKAYSSFVFARLIYLGYIGFMQSIFCFNITKY